MSSSSTRLPTPPASEMLDSVLVLITGAVLAGPMLPGFTLCVPALVLFAIIVVAPLIAAAALVTLAAAILAIPRTPETYLGRWRSGHFASPGGAALDERRAYALPEDLRLNH